MGTKKLEPWWSRRFWLCVLGLLVLAWAWPVGVPPLVAWLAIDRWLSRQDAPGCQERRSPELWGPASGFLTLLILWIYFQLLTRGTAEWFYVETLGPAYDSLGDSLLLGSSALRPDTIRWEAVKVGGQSYMYFGPWPALLRIPLNFGIEDYWGLWSRLSCFTAVSLALGSFVRLAQRALNTNQHWSAENARLLFLVSILAFGLGTPILFLAISASIYHESIVWGLAASIWALDATWQILVDEESSPASLLQLSFAVAVALLSRVTFGAPLLGVLALCALKILAGRSLTPDSSRNRRERVAAAASLLPALVAVFFQWFYNVDRFGSPLVFARLDLLEYMAANRESWESFEAWGRLNVQRIPVSVFNFFGFQGEFFSTSFPWVRAIRAWHPDGNLYPQMFDSLVISLVIVSPAFVFGSILGFWGLTRSPGHWLLKICTLGLLAQCILVFSYFIMEQRYAADFMPFMTLGYVIFLRGPMQEPRSGTWQNVLANLMLTLALVSAVNTMMSSISVIPRHGVAQPKAYRDEWSIRFQEINDSFGLREIQNEE